MGKIIIAIYRIINLINLHTYIGETFRRPIEERWKEHLHLLNTDRHFNIRLQRAWNKRGSENFAFEILKILPLDSTKEEVLRWEAHFVEAHGGVGSETCYNLTHPKTSPTLTEGMRQARSEKFSGEKNPMFGKTGENHPRFGKHWSEEWKKEQSAKQAAIWTKEKRQTHGENRKGKNNPNFEKHFSEERRKVQSEKTAASWTDERRQAQSKRMSERTGEKNPNFGRTGEKSSRFGKYICTNEEAALLRTRYNTEKISQRKLAKEASILFGKNISEGTIQAIIENRSNPNPNYTYVSRKKSKTHRPKVTINLLRHQSP